MSMTKYTDRFFQEEPMRLRVWSPRGSRWQLANPGGRKRRDDSRQLIREASAQNVRHVCYKGRLHPEVTTESRSRWC